MLKFKKSRIFPKDVLAKIIRRKEIYARNMMSSFFCYPLIDHAKVYICDHTRFMVCYGYQNERSNKQLAKFKQELARLHKSHLLQAVATVANCDEKNPMLKVILSTKTFDDKTWESLVGCVFDDRYEI